MSSFSHSKVSSPIKFSRKVCMSVNQTLFFILPTNREIFLGGDYFVSPKFYFLCYQCKTIVWVYFCGGRTFSVGLFTSMGFHSFRWLFVSKFVSVHPATFLDCILVIFIQVIRCLIVFCCSCIVRTGFGPPYFFIVLKLLGIFFLFCKTQK